MRTRLTGIKLLRSTDTPADGAVATGAAKASQPDYVLSPSFVRVISLKSVIAPPKRR